MSTCSIVVLKGQIPRKITTQDVPEYARIAGVKFMRLRHIKQFGTSSIGVRNFQGVEVLIAGDQRTSQLKYKASYSTDENGNDCGSQRTLYFEPDRRTSELLALCPDTAYNRKKLASAMLHEPFCDILDPEIEKVVREQSLEIKKTLPTGPTKEEILAKALDDVDKYKSKLALAERELKEKKVWQDRTDDVRSELDRDKGLRHFEEPQKSVPEESKPELSEVLSDEAIIRKKIVNKVHAENADMIENLKSKHGDNWKTSKDYHKKILPKINDRYDLVLSEIN